jgi:hypothetical protein
MQDANSALQATTHILQIHAPRMLQLHDIIRNLEHRLDIEGTRVTVLPPNDATRQEYDDANTVLDEANMLLDRLVNTTTAIVEEQVKKPNKALTWSVEWLNQRIEKDLKEVEETLAEVEYLMRNM